MNPKIERHPSDEELNSAIVAKEPSPLANPSRAERRKHQRGGKHSRMERRLAGKEH